MEFKDLVITPCWLIVIYLIAFRLRKAATDEVTRRYFIPGLTVKIAGAIAIGAIYQFYYGGGDTFNYFDWGSKHIWEAFKESPIKALQLIFANGEYHPSTFSYAVNIVTYRDLPSYFVVRIAGALDILTFHTYSATASLFALISFSGIWAMYKTFYKLYPGLHKQFAIAVLFVPSVFFWGSGILKDSLTIGALGWLTYGSFHLFLVRKQKITNLLIILVASYILYAIKIYILLCFLPALILWISGSYYNKIRSALVRVTFAPMAGVAIVAFSYFAVVKVGEDNKRYSIENLAFTAEATARWIAFVSQRESGSYYTLGDYDYSPAGMVRKFVPAIWVTLFRPYLWETRNPVMALSALESFAIFIFSISIFLNPKIVKRMMRVFSDPFVSFCLIFSIAFAFAVGFSTYNFGSLVRYKIPMIPYFLAALFIIRNTFNNKQETQTEDQ